MSDEPRYEPLDDMPPDLAPDDPGRRDEAGTYRAAPPIKKPVRPPTGIPPGVSVGMPAGQVVPPRAAAVPPAAQSVNQANHPEHAEEVPAPRRVQLTLPFTPALAERIKALRAKAGLGGDSPRALPLTRFFTLPANSRLEDVIAAVSSTALPLTVTLTRVEAHVQDQQTYRAAWQIDSADQLGRIRAGLVGSLKTALSAEPPFEPLIVVGENVPAKAFPALIAAMQRDFEPLTWRIETISVRDEAPEPPSA